MTPNPINFQKIFTFIISQIHFIPIGLSTVKCFSVSTFMYISTFVFFFPTEFDLKNKTSQMVLAVIFVFWMIAHEKVDFH